MKNNILDLIKDEKYLKDIDLIIEGLIDQLSRANNKFKKEIDYLNKMYNKLIKINRGESAKVIDENRFEIPPDGGTLEHDLWSF